MAARGIAQGWQADAQAEGVAWEKRFLEGGPPTPACAPALLRLWACAPAPGVLQPQRS